MNKKHLKHVFTCELKKDISRLIEEWREWFENYHKGFTVSIIDVKYTCLEIGLFEVTVYYEV